MIRPESVLRLKPDVRQRFLRPEAVVVRQSAPEVMVLNELAGELLERIDARASVRGLIDAVAPLYAIERERLEADVLAFLEELREAGVVEEIA